MKDKKRIAALGVILCMGMMMSGCAKTAETPQTEEKEVAMEDMEQPEQEAGGEEDERQPEQEADKEDAENEKQDVDEKKETNASQEMEHLGGKVQSTREDGMTLAQTTLMDEEGMVTLLEVKDAKKIPVKFTTDTKVEHWTIQGGGAGIDMKEAAFSDLEEGQSVELEGYFEGENFVAMKVIIEEYV